MIDKEFVLVSQGIEIYRTKSQEKAVGMVKEYNDEYFDYVQKCYDNYERPADNYVDLEIEYSNEKEKDKEIERLKELCNKYEEEHKTVFEEWKKTIGIIDEFDKWLLGEKMMFYKGSDGETLIRFHETVNKWLELKGVDKE